MKRFLKYSAGVLLLLVTAACSKPKEGHFRVTADYDHLHQADFFIYSDFAGFGRLDTLHVFRGKFEYEGPLANPAVITVQYPNFTTTTFVARPGESIEIDADVNELQKLEITGSEENEKLTEFRHSIAGKSLAEQTKMAKDFIEKNASSLAAVAVFVDFYALKEQFECQDLPLLEKLYKAQKNEPCVVELYTRLKPLLSKAKGAVIPDFAGEGEGYVLFTISSEQRGNVMRYQLENRQTEKGVRFREITMDNNPDSVIQAYGVRFVPEVVHVDSKGKVLERTCELK